MRPQFIMLKADQIHFSPFTPYMFVVHRDNCILDLDQFELRTMDGEEIFNLFFELFNLFPLSKEEFFFSIGFDIPQTTKFYGKEKHKVLRYLDIFFKDKGQEIYSNCTFCKQFFI